jgi:Zn-dependent peptidase ImmA (M78 family)/O-acetyl-ADP-ribose deacetylase (regulator of RNase III)
MKRIMSSVDQANSSISVRGTNKIAWTNPSVLALAGNSDPMAHIISTTRELVLKAMDDGWQGPPFDPFWLAEYLKLRVTARDDVLDARVIADSAKELGIEYNPTQPRSRTRFSIAHEIAHTLFPDCAEIVRNRTSVTHRRRDEWQLELLCNVSAAEILMPVSSASQILDTPITIDEILNQRKNFDVSVEAILLRLAKLTTQPITIFAAARERDEEGAQYRIDYAMSSSTSSVSISAGTRVPAKSVLSECTAIGYTAKRKERWNSALPELEIECVGVAPYPGNTYPRVVGIVRSAANQVSETHRIRYLIGDATDPRGTGPTIIAHVVNDKTANWGAGFAIAVARKWPEVQRDFQAWVADKRANLSLGESHIARASESVSVYSMVAQHGYGPSTKPRIRYNALRSCLQGLFQVASQNQATVHIPRIGAGQAGGNWDVISEIIYDTLVSQGVEVTVYDLPIREKRRKQTGSVLESFTQDGNRGE